LVVTHPFHPLLGRELRVLGRRWHGGRLTFFCDADGVRVRMPQEWTDQGPEPAAEPLSVESLTELRAVLDTLARRDQERAGKVDHGRRTPPR
jgi:hypothetical protein